MLYRNMFRLGAIAGQGRHQTMCLTTSATPPASTKKIIFVKYILPSFAAGMATMAAIIFKPSSRQYTEEELKELNAIREKSKFDIIRFLDRIFHTTTPIPDAKDAPIDKDKK